MRASPLRARGSSPGSCQGEPGFLRVLEAHLGGQIGPSLRAGVGAPHRLSAARLPSGLARRQGRKWARSPDAQGADPVREGGFFIRATGGCAHRGSRSSQQGREAGEAENPRLSPLTTLRGHTHCLQKEVTTAPTPQNRPLQSAGLGSPRLRPSGQSPHASAPGLLVLKLAVSAP